MQGDAKEEVRTRLNIEDVIGEYVQLKRAGRNFKGLSPFSSEKTPSFVVSPEKQIWHDFSSNRGGDVFSFVMEVEGTDFRGALEILARKAGVDLSAYESGTSQKLADKKKRLIELNELTAKYYQKCLIQNKRAIDYVFVDRKLNKKCVQDFTIGYSPDTGDALIGFLTKKNYSRQELQEAGVVNRFGGDLFRGRMMVPLMNPSGQVIGFTGRIIEAVENAPKYLNTPQTLIYDKGRHVFGLSQAKDAIRNSGFVVIVEGNLDVVSSHQAGILQVVATAGTAMTEHHINALKRLSSDIRLCFDGDAAGIAATERAIAIASGLEVSLKIVRLPQSIKDPDELIQKDPTLWREAIDNPVPAVDWVIEQYANREDLSTARGKRDFTTASLSLVSKLSDDVEREHYESIIADRIGATIETIHTKALRMNDDSTEKRLRHITAEFGDPPDMTTSYQDDLLSILMMEPAARELLSELDSNWFAGEQRQLLAQHLKTNRSGVIADTPEDLHEIDTYVKIVTLKGDTRYASWNEHDRYFEAARLVRQIEHDHMKQTRDELVESLRDAETTGDDVKADEIRQQLNKLIKEIARAK